MKLLTINLCIASAILAGCVATPGAPLCALSDKIAGCNTSYYQYKDSSLNTNAAMSICFGEVQQATQAAQISGYSGSGRGFALGGNVFKACMARLGFSPCDQGGEHLPECQ